MAFLANLIEKTGIQTLFSSHKSTMDRAGDNKITILFGSKSGNAEFIARETCEYLKRKGFKAACTNMLGYSLKDITSERYLLMVVSTHGEGEPPESAKQFYDYLHQSDTPPLPTIKYAICALGDSTYTSFCQTGKAIDLRLQELGAERLLNRIDCDAEFRDKAVHWISSVYKQLANGGTSVPEVVPEEPVPQVHVKWYPAIIHTRYALYNAGTKECWHLSLKIDELDFNYEPGDCLGIMPCNDTGLVNALLKSLGYAGNEIIETVHATESIQHALINRYELTTLSKTLLERYATQAKNTALQQLLTDKKQLEEYLHCNDVLDLVMDYPSSITPAEFITLLTPLKHRLYSIASSLKAQPGRADITVRSIKHEHRFRQRNGACSMHINKHLLLQETVSIFLKEKSNFRLPKDASAPIIMIATGTGIAPFRAFLQERLSTGASGKNWLFVGDRSPDAGYLYQPELETLHASGFLTKLNVVFSRQESAPAYVQHSIKEQSAEIIKWLNAGAYLYVCGLEKMASGIRESIYQILMEHQQLNHDQAMDALHHLRRQKRYCEDVY